MAHKTNKKLYLVIVEKPYILKRFEKVYKAIWKKLNCELDFALANNHVFDMRLESFQKISDQIRKDAVPFSLNGKPVEEHFLLGGGEFRDKCGEKIRQMVQEETYDGIVNSLDPDEAGNLSFRYLLDSLHLEGYRVVKFHMNSYSEEEIQEALVNLSDMIPKIHLLD